MAKKQKRAFDELGLRLEIAQRRSELTQEELSKKTYMCDTTIRRRFRQPGTITLNELYLFSRVLNVTLESLLDAAKLY